MPRTPQVLDVTETSLLHLRERQRQSLEPVDAARDGVEVDRKPKLHALRFMLRQSECFDPLRSEAGSVLYSIVSIAQPSLSMHTIQSLFF